MAAGDVDGDQKPEAVVLLNISSMDRTGRNHKMYGSSLLVLDMQGKLLASRDLKGMGTMVMVGDAKPGEPAEITCFLNGKMVRYRFGEKEKE